MEINYTKIKTFIKLFLTAMLIILTVSLAIIWLLSNQDSIITANRSSKKIFKTVDLKDIKNTRELELVNKDYAINSEPELASLVTSKNGIQLKMQALEAVSYLFTQARQNCPGTYVLNSGYRNLGQQEQLFNSAKDKSYVQEPAHSEHETGLAADLAVMNVKNVEKSAQSVYLRKNAWKYGLILRYPANKTNITGISDEPWHFRYVGKVHALYMVQNNLCLEEYIAKLQKIGSYSLKVDGKTYKVSSQKSVNGKLSLPKGAKYEISSDNIGNYILMSWD